MLLNAEIADLMTAATLMSWFTATPAASRGLLCLFINEVVVGCVLCEMQAGQRAFAGDEVSQ